MVENSRPVDSSREGEKVVTGTLMKQRESHSLEVVTLSWARRTGIEGPGTGGKERLPEARL